MYSDLSILFAEHRAALGPRLTPKRFWSLARTERRVIAPLAGIPVEAVTVDMILAVLRSARAALPPAARSDSAYAEVLRETRRFLDSRARHLSAAVGLAPPVTGCRFGPPLTARDIVDEPLLLALVDAMPTAPLRQHLLVSWHGALRWSEAVRVRGSDIGVDGTMRIPGPWARQVRLPLLLAAGLAGREGLLFHGCQGAMLTKSNWRTWFWRPVLRQVGADMTLTHGSLRDGHIATALAAGVDLTSAASKFGIRERPYFIHRYGSFLPDGAAAERAA